MQRNSGTPKLHQNFNENQPKYHIIFEKEYFIITT